MHRLHEGPQELIFQALLNPCWESLSLFYMKAETGFNLRFICLITTVRVLDYDYTKRTLGLPRGR